MKFISILRKVSDIIHDDGKNDICQSNPDEQDTILMKSDRIR